MTGLNPRRFYYRVEMSDSDVLYIEAPTAQDAYQTAADDPQKSIKGARPTLVTRHEVTAPRRWS